MRLLLKLSLMLCIIFLANEGCGSAPAVTVCVSDPGVGGFDCFDEATSKTSFVKYADSDKYVALSPVDAQNLFNYCAQAVKK